MKRNSKLMEKYYSNEIKTERKSSYLDYLIMICLLAILLSLMLIGNIVLADEEESDGDNEFNYGEVGSVYRVGKNDDFSEAEKEALDSDDYSYGWTMGRFTISGFSSSEEYKGSNENYKGSKVYIKNNGDKIRLSFKLEQDINKLNGDDKLYIRSAKSRDEYFQTKKIDMGKGALIVRFTDHKGKQHDPKIYTNYFESLKVGKETQISTDGPNTKIYFFEEGDYEIALDYRIGKEKKGPLFIDPKDPYQDYRVFFKFSVRNGNSMVFMRDLESNSELTNESTAAKGFMVDFAGSKYLKINVKKEQITEGRNGLVEDTRYNRPAKDGEEYTESGIYTLTVSNDYSNEQTVKKIYVGEDEGMLKLLKSSYTIDEIEDMLNKGITIDEEGSTEINTTEHNTEITTEKDMKNNKDRDNMIKVVSIISIVFVVCIAVLIMVIKSLSKKNKKKSYTDFEEEESNDNEEESDGKGKE